MKRKDKFTVVSIIVTIVCILVSIIFFFLVPNKISIQWSAAEPSNIVSKTYIFIMPIISVLTLSIGKKYLGLLYINISKEKMRNLFRI